MRSKININETYTRNKKGLATKLVGLFIGKIVVGKMDIHFQNEKPVEPSILVGNHTKFYAPLALQYMYPEDVRTWSSYKLIKTKTCYDLMRNRVLINIKGERLYRLILPIMAPILAWYFRKQMNCIPVYHDINIIETFEKTTATLKNGVHVAVYPEIRENKYNDIICHFATGFVYVAYNYYKETGKKVKFYPFYCAQSVHQIHFGTPIEYDPDIPIKEQSVNIANYLENQLIDIARGLPPHKIVSMLSDIFNE